MNQPDAHQPRYQGRPLARPDEDIEDQGLRFDIGTLLSRRGILTVFGAGAVGVALSACGVQATSSTASSTASTDTASGGSTTEEIPDETAGPYPGDGSNGPDVLEQSGIIRSDIRSSFGTGSATATGVAMTLELTILDLANGGSGFEGVAVYAWHCDAQGNYSMYSTGLENENYLRGVQIADADGTVSFTSIVPGCYSGRWPHIHFEVYPDAATIVDADQAIATSQVALPQSMCDAVYTTSGYEASVANLAAITLATDNVFGDDGGARQLGAASGSVTDGFTVRLTAPVDTRTEPTGGTAPASGGRPGSR